MNINTDIYGDAASWYYSPAFNSTLTTFFNNNEALLNAFKASPPKSVNFGGTDNSEKGMLSRGISENKTPANVAIDNSIVAIGQDPAVSPFGKMKCVQFVSRSGWTPTRTITEIEKTAPINVFFATWQGASSYYDNMTAWAFRVDSNANSIWGPNSNATNNPNMRVFPLASYGAKSLLLTPMVFSTPNDIGGAQNGNWRTLNEWRDNYSNEYAYAIALKVQVVNSITASTIGYGSTGFSTTQRITAALWDSIGDNDNTHIDYCFTYDTITAMGNMLFLMKYFGYNAPVVQNQITTHWQGYFPNVDLFDHCEFKQTWSLTTSAIEIVRWGYKIGYSDNNYNVIMKWAALFGAPFTPTRKTSFGTMFNDSDLYFPIIDNNGIAHGEYTHGTDNLNNPFNDRTSTRDYNYDPSANIDPNIYSNITGFNALTSGATMTKRYVLDAANVEKLGDDLWTICGSLSSTDFEHFDGKLKDEFLTTNPIDSIISLQRFPFEIPHTGSAKAQIKLGKSTVSAEGYTTFNPFNTIVFSGKDIFPRFGDCFLDYEPYTSYEVYVPFCGTTKIRAADILGHTLNINMQIDLFTGSCTAYIMADQLVIETLNGSCGVDQTLSGAQTATMNANIFNGILNQKAADRQETTTLAKMAFPTGWIPTILNPVGGYEKIESAKTQSQIANYEITHVNVPPHKIGAASPLLGWIQEFDARIIIYYPEGNVIDSTIPPSLNDSAIKAFGSVKGFATASPGTASNFHGYTQGTIIADSIPCTQSERERIKQAFESGVFLP